LNQRLPKAILLDLDDTILNDSGGVEHCWSAACSTCASELAEVDSAALLEAIGRTQRWFWSDRERHREGRLDLGAARRRIVGRALAEVGADPALAERIAESYGNQRDAAIQPFQEAIETVRWLRECGSRLALLTNGSAAAQRSKISRFELADLFDSILIEGEVGYGKPDPRIYAQALRNLGVAPAQAWMVGDNLEWDVAQPQLMGVFGIWIDIHGAGLPAGHAVRPDRIVSRLSELRSSAPDRH